MREVLAAAAGVLSRQRGIVLVVAVGALLPAELLTRAPSSSLYVFSLVGSLTLIGADVALVAILLADLHHEPLASIGFSRIMGASLRLLVASLIATLPLVLLGVSTLAAIKAASPSLGPSLNSAGLYLIGAIVAFVSVPFALLMPVCLQERGGPLWSLKRAWSLSRLRRIQVWVLMGVLWIASVGYGLLSHVPGWAPAAALIACSIVHTVLLAAMVAVLYVRLVAEEPPPPVIPAVRSRTWAAEGTFRESKGHRTKGSHRHR